MAMSADKAINLVCEEYEGFKTLNWIKYRNMYVVIGTLRGFSEIHLVMENGTVSGNIPIMAVIQGEDDLSMAIKQAMKKNPKNSSPQQQQLQHSGVKGQKWGVRQYQFSDGTYTELGKERRRVGDGRENEKTGMSVTTKFRLKEKLRVAAQSVVATAAGVGVTVLLGPGAGLAAFYLASAGSVAIELAIVNKRNKKAKELQAQAKNHPCQFKKQQEQTDTDQNLEIVNEEGWGQPGRSNNCACCTTAMEMRQRGFEVKAGYSSMGYTEDQIETFFKDAKADQLKTTWSKMNGKAVQTYPQGSRGFLNVYGIYGGGHSMYWKVQSGKLVIYDGQTGKKYDMSSGKSQKFMKQAFIPFNANFIRVDNLEPNLEAIQYIVMDR